jgi:hypothetical protein
MSSSKIQELIKHSKILEHADQPSVIKKKSLVESGITNKESLDFLCKLKRGPLATITLYLDDVEMSDCGIRFRLLTAQESLDIELEMQTLGEELNLSPTSIAYSIYYISKTLSRASKLFPGGDNFKIQPDLSELDLRLSIDTDTLIAIGNKYLEFKNKYCPQLENITDNDIEEFVKELDGCEEDLIKKLVLLNGLKSRQTERAVLLDIHKRYQETTKQLDKLFTG